MTTAEATKPVSNSNQSKSDSFRARISNKVAAMDQSETTVGAHSNSFRERIRNKVAATAQHKTTKAVITGVKAIWNLSPTIGFYALKFGVNPHNAFLQNPNIHINPSLLKFGLGIAVSATIYALSNREQMRVILGRDVQ